MLPPPLLYGGALLLALPLLLNNPKS